MTRARRLSAIIRTVVGFLAMLGVIALAFVLPGMLGGDDRGADLAAQLSADDDARADADGARATSPSPQPSTTATTAVVTPTSDAGASTATSQEVDPSATGAADQIGTPEPVGRPGDYDDPLLRVELAVESRVADVGEDELATVVFQVLNDERSWGQAGFEFVERADSELRLVLAEGPEVDELCLPLRTQSQVSCQNGPIVALNADRWRTATTTWDAELDDYRTYLVNHEVGHLIGQRHPTPRCPSPGAPAAVMEQQTRGLEGCIGNGWPRAWEIVYARARPAKIGPTPDWAPDPVPANLEADP